MSNKTELKKQKKIWYAKLKESGFEDLEYENQDLKHSSLPRLIRGNKPMEGKLRAEAIQEYYYMAYHFLNSFTFSSELHKAMWAYHTEGMTVREIARVINETKVFRTSKTTVWVILKALEDKMKSLYLAP